MIESRSLYWRQCGILFATYVVVAKLCLTLDAVSGFASLVWPASGIALASLFLFGLRLWPAVALGAFLVNYATGAPALAALFIAAGNALEALAGAYLLKKHGMRPTLDRLQDALKLVALAALLSTAISATMGVVSLYLSGVLAAAAIGPTWIAWWVGDALGDLIIAPLIMTWAAFSRLKAPRPPKRIGEACAYIAFCLALGLVLSGKSPLGGISAAALPYFVLPLATWAALRFGVQANVTITFLLASIAVAATVFKVGPFTRDPLSEGLTLLQLFMGAFAITSLILAAAIAERIHANELILRKSIEEKLLLSEERFRLLVGAVKDYAIVMLDPNGQVVSWNAGAKNIKGYEASEILGKHFSIFYPATKNDEAKLNQQLEIARLSGRFEDEGWRTRKDGSQFFANVIITALFDPNGTLYGYSKVTRDITERKQAEIKMQALNEELEARVEQRTAEARARATQLRAITDAIPTLVAEFDTSERYLFVNGACEKWFGPANHLVEGKKLIDMIGLERYRPIAPYIQQVLDGEEVTFAREWTMAGVKTYFSTTLIPEFDVQNRVIGFISVATDISKHWEAQEAAEAANAAKSAFLANMSHEIRTPLGAVIGFSDLLVNQALTEKERESYIAVIKRNGELLSNIISDILDLSKVEAGKLEIDKQDVPLGEALTDVTTMLTLQAEEKGLHLSVKAEGPIPRYVEADALRLRQILINVVGNAIKFTKSGSVRVTIKQVEEATGQPKLAFVVKDTGPGIAPENAARLFEPFTQADASTKRKFGGTGLGLGLSKRLANLLGGDVELTDSVLGEGSTFTITIDPGAPTAKGPAKDYSKPEENLPATELTVADMRLDGFNILLVEDAPDNQLLVGRYLTTAGAAVDTANNGKEAVQLATDRNYDLLLMDLQMPIMDGYEATATLRKNGFSKPIIALTAHAMKEERQRCLASGFDDHISKPISRKTLLTCISHHRTT